MLYRKFISRIHFPWKKANGLWTEINNLLPVLEDAVGKPVNVT